MPWAVCFGRWPFALSIFIVCVVYGFVKRILEVILRTASYCHLLIFAVQRQIAIEQSTNENLDDIDHTQKALLVAIQSLTDSAQRLTEIAEDRGLLPKSGDDISSEISKGNAQEKHIDNQRENEDAEPKD